MLVSKMKMLWSEWLQRLKSAIAELNEPPPVPPPSTPKHLADRPKRKAPAKKLATKPRSK